jgi:hypothetical protein
MAELTSSELQFFPNWSGCIEICFLHITPGGKISQVLDAWTPHLNEQTIRFADYILHRIIGKVPFARLAGDTWIARCLELALSTRDESLVESLLLILRCSLREFPKLLEVAREIPSQQIRRVLRNVGQAT